MPTRAAEPASKAFPFAFDQHDLANGLRLITVPTDYPNVVALYIVVQTGSRNEVEPGKSGFAHFFEHVMFRGTKNVPRPEYEQYLTRIGASSNASTWEDRTQYHAAFAKEDLDVMLRLEADRFQNLFYSEDVFRTEALAVLGEYNKNSAEPTEKLNEVLYDTAFDRHTYKHTSMGFLKDIQDMPNQFAYSKQFFDRYYRPENTTIIVAGDVAPERVRPLVEKYWAGWKRGSYHADIPPEPPHAKPRRNHIDWPTATLPYVTIAFRSPAYDDAGRDSAALDILAAVAFSENSDLYRKLVIEDQIVDRLTVDNADHIDPNLFEITARVKKKEDLLRVEKEILTTAKEFQEQLVPATKLDTVKRRLRYGFALHLNNSETIAESLAHYVALRRTPDTINNIYNRYAEVSPADVRRVAKKYFTDNERTIVTLVGK